MGKPTAGVAGVAGIDTEARPDVKRMRTCRLGRAREALRARVEPEARVPVTETGCEPRSTPPFAEAPNFREC